MLTQLVHNGVIVPEVAPPAGLHIVLLGRSVELAPKQEEMALAWARKKDTPYPDDPVFERNFMRDFGAELGIEDLSRSQIDFGPCYRFVDLERAGKESLSREDRKALAAGSKKVREALKAKYGYAIVNGQRVELGTYLAEPSGIFMGRGQHPLRGRWKEGASRSNIVLNLSPDAPRPEGAWGEIVWQPESMWVARWHDKLTGKLKYIWLSDTAPLKQEREARKFDRALSLEARLSQVRARIQEGLVDPDPRRRTIATACYLIDVLCLRVGDEKDPDEADTVGATTLRPEHVTLREDGVVEFKFLGKDSVEWHKTLEPPQVVLGSLQDLCRNARPSRSPSDDARTHPSRDLPQLFPDVTSRDVNAFLSSIVPGLSAKVFRTYHATAVVSKWLAESGAQASDPEYTKWRAVSLANLEAAVLCNHTKQYNGDWKTAVERHKVRRQSAEERAERYRVQIDEYRKKLAALRNEARESLAASKTAKARKKQRERYARRIELAEGRVVAAKQRRSRADDSLGKIRAQHLIAGKKRTWNLGTSLKSYIDPRVCYDWGKQIDYDVLGRYYPTALRRKYAWVRATDEGNLEGLEQVEHITVRPCMATDLERVAGLVGALKEDQPDLVVPADADEIGRAYLPSLGQTWREALIAVDDEEQIIAFAVVGPEWQQDEQPLLDILCLVHTEKRSVALARLLCLEIENRVQAYQLNQPRKRFALRARDESWYACAPAVVSELDLVPDDESDEDEEE